MTRKAVECEQEFGSHETCFFSWVRAVTPSSVQSHIRFCRSFLLCLLEMAICRTLEMTPNCPKERWPNPRVVRKTRIRLKLTSLESCQLQHNRIMIFKRLLYNLIGAFWSFFSCRAMSWCRKSLSSYRNRCWLTVPTNVSSDSCECWVEFIYLWPAEGISYQNMMGLSCCAWIQCATVL